MAKKEGLKMFQSSTMGKSKLTSDLSVAKARINNRTTIAKGDNSLTAYMKEIKRLKSLTKPEERELTERILKGDSKAVKMLVEANLKFVIVVCRNYQNQGLSMVDLISEGNLGLLRAARRFDGTRDFKFISYAVWWIRQGILMALAEQSRVFNVSPNKIGLAQKIGKTKRKLEQELGRQPDTYELSSEMNISESKVLQGLLIAKSSVSLSREFIFEGEGNAMDFIPDQNTERTDNSATKWIVEKRVSRMLSGMKDRERDVLKLFYGIGTHRAWTLGEIGVRFNLTRERIRQIKETGLQKLKHSPLLNQISLLPN